MLFGILFGMHGCQVSRVEHAFYEFVSQAAWDPSVDQQAQKMDGWTCWCL